MLLRRPQDLLHQVGFDWSLLDSSLHARITGVQVTYEERIDSVHPLTVDLQFSIPNSSCPRFGCDRQGTWSTLKGLNEGL